MYIDKDYEPKMQWRTSVILLGWTLVIAISLTWNVWNAEKEAYTIAENSLRMSSTKDVIFRNWATGHGGVYVPVTDDTPPSPYLNTIVEREIVSPSGRTLTLVNPAYMMRQVYELARDQYGVQGQLVSHTPINPQNMADEWEQQALKTFSVDVKEVSAITTENGMPIIRYIKPFYVEEGCLVCHEQQGYQVGDLRGAISTQTPMLPFLEAYYNRRTNVALGHVLIWVFGAVGILWTANRLKESTRIVISEEKYRTIVENTNDALFMHDFKGNIIDLNDKASSLIGYEREEIIGENLQKISNQETSNSMQEQVEKLLEYGSLVFEGVDIHKNGREIPIEISAKVVSREGNGLIQSFVRDISQRKKAERDLLEANKKLEEAIIKSKELAQQAEESSLAKSQFLASMSHEIRTPMNAVLGMTELLEEYSENADQEKYIEILKKNGNNLLTIINAVLDLSKAEAGKMELNIQEIVVCDILIEIGATFQPLVKKKGLTISIDANSCTPRDCTVLADGDKIRQVLINLVSNAMKFTERGDIKVSFQTIDNAVMRFSVNDQGVGISKEKLEDVFHAFNRGDVSTTQTYAGTGLGLTISKKLVEIMGGRIWVDSQIGGGSTFYFDIPYQQVERQITLDLQEGNPVDFKGEDQDGKLETTGEQNVFQEQIMDVNSKLPRILLAEDIEDNRVLFLAFLKNEQIEIDVVENGLEALQRYKEALDDPSQQPYSLILMDMQMPVMDGYQATREIRRWERVKDSNPVVIYALTAYALKEEREKSMEAGCDEHLTKPIKKQQLLEVVRKHTIRQ